LISISLRVSQDSPPIRAIHVATRSTHNADTALRIRHQRLSANVHFDTSIDRGHARRRITPANQYPLHNVKTARINSNPHHDKHRPHGLCSSNSTDLIHSRRHHPT
jgi:hypothetical protein